MTPEQERERDGVGRIVLAFAWTLLGMLLLLRLQNALGIALAFGLEGLGWGMAFLLHSKACPKGLTVFGKLKIKETNL
jgi:hypothetical protein